METFLNSFKTNVGMAGVERKRSFHRDLSLFRGSFSEVIL